MARQGKFMAWHGMAWHGMARKVQGIAIQVISKHDNS
jgi:hypothetical protein